MNAISANDTGWPEYLGQMKAKAMRLECLLGAVSACIDEEDHRDICTQMIEEGWTIARALNLGLDTVNLPDEGEA